MKNSTLLPEQKLIAVILNRNCDNCIHVSFRPESETNICLEDPLDYDYLLHPDKVCIFWKTKHLFSSPTIW